MPVRPRATSRKVSFVVKPWVGFSEPEFVLSLRLFLVDLRLETVNLIVASERMLEL